MLDSSWKRFLLVMSGWLWVLALAGIVLALFWPMLGRGYREEEGRICNDNLERIFEAKQALARDLNLDPSRPYPPIVQQRDFMKDLSPYLRKDRLDLSCPSGGSYQIRPLVDSKGEVVPPTCDHAAQDPDGDGFDEASEGLHIHARSYLQNSDTGLWSRDPGLTFPGDPGTLSR